MADVDNIMLGGQSFRVKGSVVASPISEFTTGLKVGKATYDEREHAFFLVLDDFSGGVGVRRLDIREELGTIWDNQGGVDTRRPGHVTLPPLQTGPTAIAAPTGYTYLYRWPSQPMSAYPPVAVNLFAGFGSGIYYTPDGGTNLTKIKDITNAEMIAAVLYFNKYLYAFPECHLTPTTKALYERATADPTIAGNWAAGGSGTTKEIFDATVWDGKLIGTTNAAVTYLPIIVFSVDGAVWNIDDATDAQPIWTGVAGRIRFVGAAMAEWDEPAVYFIARTAAGIEGLYALDFFARKAYPVNILPNTFIVDACVWNGYIVVTDGVTVLLYTPGQSSTTRDITPPRKGGIPPSLQQSTFLRLFSIGNYLYCLVHQYGAKSQVWCYNGIGWSPIGAQVTSKFSCLAVAGLSWQLGIYSSVQRRIIAFGNTDHATNSDPQRLLIDLPWYSDVPTYGIDNFSATASPYITGWIDGGFREVDGTLFRMTCNGWNLSADESVKVEYQIDNNEAGAWTQMRSSADAVDVFDAITKTLYFHATTPRKGVAFRTVRFRITLSRGSTATHTPELESFVLVYDKKPNLRTAWAFRIDVNGMTERAGLATNQYSVDGVAATVALIWEKLRTLWDTKPLLQLDVPSIQSGVYVRLSSMAATFDEFRTEVAGKGYIDVQCLEPVNA